MTNQEFVLSMLVGFLLAGSSSSLAWLSRPPTATASPTTRCTSSTRPWSRWRGSPPVRFQGQERRQRVNHRVDPSTVGSEPLCSIPNCRPAPWSSSTCMCRRRWEGRGRFNRRTITSSGAGTRQLPLSAADNADCHLAKVNRQVGSRPAFPRIAACAEPLIILIEKHRNRDGQRENQTWMFLFSSSCTMTILVACCGLP